MGFVILNRDQKMFVSGEGQNSVDVKSIKICFFFELNLSTSGYLSEWKTAFKYYFGFEILNLQAVFAKLWLQMCD